MALMLDALILKNTDNTATALRDIKAEELVRVRLGEEILTQRVTDDIPYGHKFALAAIAGGTDILKYGEVIGRATAAIKAGGHVHVQNVESLRARGDLS